MRSSSLVLLVWITLASWFHTSSTAETTTSVNKELHNYLKGGTTPIGKVKTEGLTPEERGLALSDVLKKNRFAEVLKKLKISSKNTNTLRGIPATTNRGTNKSLLSVVLKGMMWIEIGAVVGYIVGYVFGKVFLNK